MGHKPNGDLGGICGYAKTKYDERVEQKNRRRSQSVPSALVGAGARKLVKPPKPPSLRTLSETPRNRLRKQTPSQLAIEEPTIDLYVLEYEPDRSSGELSRVLGVYSSFDSVTLGALKHGAYTFSREGILVGNEYLSPTGRIRFVKSNVQHAGMRTHVPERSISPNGAQVRLDIPHPESGQSVPVLPAAHQESSPAVPTVFIAHRRGPQAASWIGMYGDKSLAWGACLKDRAMCAVTMPLTDEVRSIGENNMPQASARVAGCGRFTWTVEEIVVDGSHAASFRQ